ncbi:MAG: hypothetical protein AAB266_00315, partial [Nitrospirota bacterium]
TNDLPDGEGQIKADYNAPAETTNGASDPGVKLNIDTTLNQEQENLNAPEITIVINKHVVNHITYFQTRMKDRFTLWLSRSSLYIPMMR